MTVQSTKPFDSRVPFLDPIAMLFKSRSFVSAVLLLGITLICYKIPDLAPLRDEMFTGAMVIITLIFFKNTSISIADTAAAARIKAAQRPITDREAMTKDIYDEMTNLMHDVMFGSASSTPSDVKEAIAQGVIKAEAKQVAGTSNS